MTENSKKSGFLWTIAAIVLAGILGWIAVETHRGGGDDIAFLRSYLQVVHADGSKSNFHVDLAVTPEQQEHGLMFRKKLDMDHGMLFLWPVDQPVSMWMKNTLIPLDMLFVDREGRIVKIISNAVPNDLTPLSSGGPVRAVVEIGGGEAEHQNIQLGDTIVSPGFVVTK